MCRSLINFTFSLVWRSWWLSRNLFNRIVLIYCLTRISSSVIVVYLSISNDTIVLSSISLTIHLSIKTNRLFIEMWRLTLRRMIAISFVESHGGIMVANCSQTILNIEVRSLCFSSCFAEITWCLLESLTYVCAYIYWVTLICCLFSLMKWHLVVDVRIINGVILSICFTS